LLLNAGSGAAIARPTFSRDFAGEKTLNNGTGPAITFTRASNATYFDANGTLQTAANDAPRFDHDPATGASRGLLIEEARTNSIRNSQAGGAVAGSAGTGPSNWNVSGNANGLTRTISLGSANGLSYVDVRFVGTATATVQNFFDPEGLTAITASSSQVWTHSAYVALIAGTVPDLQIGVREGLADGTFVTSGNLNAAPSLTASLQRFSHTRTLTDATTARVTPTIRVSISNGVAYDFTLRIAAPQLEQGAFATSYIPTTSAAATRSADSAVVTPISSFYNQSEGTLFAEGSFGRRNIGEGFASLAQETFGRGLNGGLRTAASTANFLFRNSAAPTPNLNEVNDNSANLDGVTIQKMAAAHNSLGHVFGSAIGRSVVSDEADTISPLPVCDRLLIGEHNNNGPTPKLNGHIRKLAYWPRRLSNTLLQQLTT
jgi:hypothetical protein